MTESKEIFKQRKKRQILVAIVAFVAVMILAFSELQIPMFAVIVGVLVFSWTNWRCPNCNKYLGRGSNPKHCTNCGEELQ